MAPHLWAVVDEEDVHLHTLLVAQAHHVHQPALLQTTLPAVALAFDKRPFKLVARRFRHHRSAGTGGA